MGSFKDLKSLLADRAALAISATMENLDAQKSERGGGSSDPLGAMKPEDYHRLNL
jgi:hypothetical protein